MAMSDRSANPRSTGAAHARTGWYGWVMFAGVMMLLLGSFHAIAGLVALFEDDYFLVTRSGLVVDMDFTAWGWTHLVLGLVVAIAGGALFSGATWARVVAIVVAIISALVNLTFLAAYPLWSGIMIGLDILVIYAVSMHGDPAEMR